MRTRPKGDTALNQRILRYVEANPGKTATEIAKAAGGWAPTVSSFLTKQVRVGVMFRKKGIGPRGGFGYSMPKPAPRKSVWERLSEDDPVY